VLDRVFFFLIIFLFFLSGCSKEPPRHVVPAFYHWQTELRLTAKERRYLDDLGVQTLFVKFFDVDWDEASGQPLPLATLQIDTANLGGLQIVPTVFITNRTLLNLSEQDVPTLAENIFAKTVDLAAGLPAFSPKSFQFDCDWTGKTKDKFFLLIAHFKKIAAATITDLSATIRLHQLKYFDQTGVPPVDRGMLMFYNMGDLENQETANSILDLESARQYLPQSPITVHQSPYPLPLDLALPLFSWGVLFRDGEMIKLINDLSEADLSDTARFVKIAPGRFRVKKSTYLKGYYLYEGDLLRPESMNAGQLEEAAALAGRVCARPELTVAFYHLDTSTLEMFPLEALERIVWKLGN
jgi:hypothetical protein